MRRKAEYRVTFDLPEGATLADGKAYVLDAVSSYKGGLDHVNNPMSWLDQNTVRVARITRPIK